MRDMVVRVLEDDYDIVASVANGQELIEAVDLVAADLLVIDLEMPIITGWEALRTIRRNGVTTPVVILTNSDDIAVVDEVLRIGANAFVIKDFLAVDFQPAIRDALGGQRFVSPRVK